MVDHHHDGAPDEKRTASRSSHSVLEAMYGAAMLLGTAQLLEQKGAEKLARSFRDAAHCIYDLTDELQQQIPDFEDQLHATGHSVVPGAPDRDDVFAAEYKRALESLLEVKFRNS